MEGALKLKEISYLRAEGYPAGELKHGPIALIEPGTVVVAVATPSRLQEKVARQHPGGEGARRHRRRPVVEGATRTTSRSTPTTSIAVSRSPATSCSSRRSTSCRCSCSPTTSPRPAATTSTSPATSRRRSPSSDRGRHRRRRRRALRRLLARRPSLRDRLFTDVEAGRLPRRPSRLAARFAAKEATMKALGVGLGAFGFHDAWVERESVGPSAAPR